MLAHLWQVPHRLDEPLRRVPGVGAREANAATPGCRRPRRAAPRSRSQARRARRSGSRSGRAGGPHCGPDAPPPHVATMSAFGRIRSWPRVTARRRSAVIVASLDDRHVGPHRIAAARHADGKRHVVEAGHVDRRRTRLAGPLDQAGQFLEAMRAEHDVDDLAVGPVSSASPSCCATQPATTTTGRRPVSSPGPQFAQPRVELVLGVLPDAAGIDDDDIRIERVLGAS